ncbi:Mediator of RNA polymerase II transcription subunit 27-B [Nymphon striatum]|nr:Mediator of RNA polymerase II transcription subunit 27-B [Nymphon striatum]
MAAFEQQPQKEVYSPQQRCVLVAPLPAMIMNVMFMFVRILIPKYLARITFRICKIGLGYVLSGLGYVNLVLSKPALEISQIILAMGQKVDEEPLFGHWVSISGVLNCREFIELAEMNNSFHTEIKTKLRSMSWKATEGYGKIKMADAPKLELIGLSLKTIKALRAAVGHVFEFLGEGLKSQDAEEENHRMLLQELQQALVNFEPKYATAEKGEASLYSSQSSSENDEKASRIGEQSWFSCMIKIRCALVETGIFFRPSQKLFKREFDTLVQSLGAPTGLVSLENSGLLSQDTTSEAAHEVGNNAAVLLTQNSLKRSNINPGISVKRSRKLPPTSHIVPTQYFRASEILVKNFNFWSFRGFYKKKITYRISSLDSMRKRCPLELIEENHALYLVPHVLGSNRKYFNSPITLSRTLKAVVVLRSLIIEHVTVKAYHEELHTEDGKLDIWSGSRYKIFQRVSDNANAAALHFYSPLIPDLAIKSFMTWLHSLSSLFEAPCRRCGLYLHDSTIPTWRDFRSLEAYHEACRA